MCQSLWPHTRTQSLATRRSFLACGTALLASAGPCRAAPAAADALLEPTLRLPIAPDGAPCVALTLDACPGAFDERIAQALIEARAPATIFVTALWMRQNREALALLLAHPDLFTLENHGARHIPAVLGGRTVYGLTCAGTLDHVRQEVEDGAAAILAASGVAPRWYRAATARYSPAALSLIQAMGHGIAGYSLNADGGASLPAAVVATRMAQARHGDVIIGHINQPHRPSGAGIAIGVRALKRAGVRFVPLGPPPAIDGQSAATA